MNISKTDYDKLVAERDYLEARHAELRDTVRDQTIQMNNFDEILDKIGRAAHGYPIVMDRNSGVNGMTPGYYGGHQGEQHQCQVPGEIEVLRYDLLIANQIRTELERQLAAVKAIAEFAKEHKA